MNIHVINLFIMMHIRPNMSIKWRIVSRIMFLLSHIRHIIIFFRGIFYEALYHLLMRDTTLI
ncbi:MAG: hypothetical protein FD153_2065 [Rhodospirillaceae bacterium]|nr:MAG: hypothetical protein FD153_2065 [Rhodospirillaceae bacterium]